MNSKNRKSSIHRINHYRVYRRPFIHRSAPNRAQSQQNGRNCRHQHCMAASIWTELPAKPSSKFCVFDTFLWSPYICAAVVPLRGARWLRNAVVSVRSGLYRDHISIRASHPASKMALSIIEQQPHDTAAENEKMQRQNGDDSSWRLYAMTVISSSETSISIACIAM